MNAALPRILKSAYRKEPLISTFITIGAVDALIGGVDDSWSLFAFGLTILGISVLVRLLRMEPNNSLVEEPEKERQLYLPQKSSSSSLPMLSISKKEPPQ
ncbi:MAG: hypothetical protein AAF378_05915 [Cyanobacteria bacterium P01_A01_bin.84]